MDCFNKRYPKSLDILQTPESSIKKIKKFGQTRRQISGPCKVKRSQMRMYV